MLKHIKTPSSLLKYPSISIQYPSITTVTKPPWQDPENWNGNQRTCTVAKPRQICFPPVGGIKNWFETNKKPSKNIKKYQKGGIDGYRERHCDLPWWFHVIFFSQDFRTFLGFSQGRWQFLGDNLKKCNTAKGGFCWLSKIMFWRKKLRNAELNNGVSLFTKQYLQDRATYLNVSELHKTAFYARIIATMMVRVSEQTCSNSAWCQANISRWGELARQKHVNYQTILAERDNNSISKETLRTNL